ncbi:hypothetical protein [Cupriavidus sp. BIC8F]|uniref:hypothetical protein n=1 Tax=Cupriavidus sp. BIC8F TaxID=3079014 RepID=UPI002916DDAA|nr:hypothetical protein [Cupriavidus sp. BIC8F]
MQAITAFAIFSTRRLDEITRRLAAASLQRYTHLRHTGDRFVDWKWLEIVAPASEDSGAAEQ